MREMRLAKREITDPEVLKEIVEECDTVRLGLTDAEGMFIVPVNYGYEFTEENGKAELQLYFHGAAEGRKADALKSQSPVAVEMDCRHGIITGDYTCAYSYSYRSIMGNGTVSLLETFEEKEKGLQRIMEHMAPGAKIEFRPEMYGRSMCMNLPEKSERRNKWRGAKFVPERKGTVPFPCLKEVH